MKEADKLEVLEAPSGVTFVSRFVDELPQDPLGLEHSKRPRQVESACYSRVEPSKTLAPRCIAFSNDLSEDIGLSSVLLLSSDHQEPSVLERVLSGNALFDGMQPYSMCYGGHQFGNWAGQLGDGRAINLGEIEAQPSESKSGEPNSNTSKSNKPNLDEPKSDEPGRIWQLQLKGAGRTPYSRHADGLAVLRSSVREFLCSESMYYLGIPTTRALSLCLTGDSVERDMFYDGRPQMEPGAVVCRVSKSFIRFGSFEIFAARGDFETLEKLAAYTIKHHFSHLQTQWRENKANAYLDMFREVASTTKTMIIDWMRVGFVHGVMNTDNMSILGETIDYGPYGWLDNFDPQWTPNTTDKQHKRYRYGNQAAIAQWNLLQLANALFPLIKKAEPLEDILKQFAVSYENDFLIMRLRKLGFDHVAHGFLAENTPSVTELSETRSDKEIKVSLDTIQKKNIENLLDKLDECLIGDSWDMTLFYRCLATFLQVSFKSNNHEKFSSHANMKIASDLSSALSCDGNKRTILIDGFSNAYYGKLGGNCGKADKDDSSDDLDSLASWIRDYLGVCILNDSLVSEQVEFMNSVNPYIILRNYITQEAIDLAYAGDYSRIYKLQQAFMTPYEENENTKPFSLKRPGWALNKAGCSTLSCSS